MYFDVFHLIMVLVFYIIVPIMYFVVRNEVKPKKNIILGATLPYGAAGDSDVEKVCREFKKELNITSVVLTVTAFFGFFIKYDSIVFLYMSVWLIAALVIAYVPYVRANGRLRRLKVAKGWQSPSEGKTVVDLKAVGVKANEIDIWMFIIPSFLSLIPVILESYNVLARGNDPVMLLCYGALALTAIVCLPIYRLIFRQKSDVFTEDTNVSVALTRVRKYHWGKVWLWMVWLTAAANIVWYLFSESWVGFAALMVYSLALIYICLRAEFDARRAQQKLTEDITSGGEYVDEDRYWLWGMFYFNENDKHVMINNRVGVGTTVNLASAGGKAIVGFSVAALLIMPIMGIFIIKMEFTPVKVYMSGDVVVAEHTKVEYEINTSDIENYKVTDHVDATYRVMGTGMDTVCKGKFKVDGYGTCYLCLDPRDNSFVIISTVQGETYIFSADKELIAELREKASSV